MGASDLEDSERFAWIARNVSYFGYNGCEHYTGGKSEELRRWVDNQMDKKRRYAPCGECGTRIAIRGNARRIVMGYHSPICKRCIVEFDKNDMGAELAFRQAVMEALERGKKCGKSRRGHSS